MFIPIFSYMLFHRPFKLSYLMIFEMLLLNALLGSEVSPVVIDANRVELFDGSKKERMFEIRICGNPLSNLSRGLWPCDLRSALSSERDRSASEPSSFWPS